MSQPTDGRKPSEDRQPAGQPKQKMGGPKKQAAGKRARASGGKAAGRGNRNATPDGSDVGEAVWSVLGAISRGVDPARIVVSATPDRQERVRAMTLQAGKRKRSDGRPSQQADKRQERSQPKLRVRNGDVAALWAAADRSLRNREAAERDAKQKRKPDRKCRECLKAKPDAAFPAKVAVCADCGGQPRSNSVRAVSAGLPTTGRRH